MLSHITTCLAKRIITMNTTSIRSIFAAILLIGTAVCLSATEPAKEDAALATKLISAIEKSDYDGFVADGEVAFKQLKKEQFEAVATQLGPKFKQGHQAQYLGELKQKGYHVTLWKISFSDGSDDALATLSVKEGKVGGFWIR